MDSRRVLAVSVLVLLAACAGSPTDGTTPGAGPTPDSGATPDAGTATDDGNEATGGNDSPTGANGTTTDANATGTPTATSRPAAGTDRPTATVEAVASADTLVVRYANGSIDRVRLVGVETPPAHGRPDATAFAGVPDTRAGEDCLRGVGEEAETALSRRLVGVTVTLEIAGTGPARDPAGRLRATPRVGDLRVERLLLLRGYARVVESEHPDTADALGSQANARAAGAGVWRCADLSWDAGGTSPLSISRVHADAGGRVPDRRNPNDEYVVLSNTGNASVDLAGWRLFDAEGANDYEFPDGFSLGPGGSVTLHSGDGADSDGHLYWGLGRGTWENDGDVVYVRQANGSVAVRYAYGNRSGP